MTAKEVFEYSLIELNKVEAPSLLLEDYNYFINKAILSYVNKRYNVYDMNQQTTDDLRILKGTTVLTSLTATTGNRLQGATYTATLPLDYFHLLNCVVEYVVAISYKCYNAGDHVYYGAKRLTADMYSQIINNYYMRPSYKMPYYYLHNVIDPALPVHVAGTNDADRLDGGRNANSIAPKLEIRYGKDNTLFVLTSVTIDYLKSPRYVRLTQAQLDLTEDTSDILEFPDFICIEIIKELVALLMENASDPRLNTNLPINQTIAPPQAAGQTAPQGHSSHKR
jgi:hypothetical protein